MLVYKFIPHKFNKFTFQLLSLPNQVTEFLERERVFSTSQGVSFLTFGEKLIFDDGNSVFDGQGSIGLKPMNIIIPRGGDRLHLDRENYQIQKHFRSSYDMPVYCRSICSAFAELYAEAISDADDKGKVKRNRGNPYLFIIGSFVPDVSERILFDS